MVLGQQYSLCDDTVLFADNMEDLRDMLGTVGECSEKMGPNINTKKTKFMIITLESHKNFKSQA